MTERLTAILNDILNRIDKVAPGAEKSTLLQVKERINSVLEEAEATDASAAAFDARTETLKTEHAKAMAKCKARTLELEEENLALRNQNFALQHRYPTEPDDPAGI